MKEDEVIVAGEHEKYIKYHSRKHRREETTSKT